MIEIIIMVISVPLIVYGVGALAMKFTYPKKYGKPSVIETFIAGFVFTFIIMSALMLIR